MWETVDYLLVRVNIVIVREHKHTKGPNDMKNLNEVVIGTQLTGNWGAMIPVSYGTVTGIIKSVGGV